MELANEVLEMKPDSYEAYYARAKARLDLKLYELALTDVKDAMRLSPPQNMEVRKVLAYLQEDISNRMCTKNPKIGMNRDYAVSVDTLLE